MTQEILKETIDALGYAFHEFKDANDQRLKHLESKKAIDPLLLEKIERINRNIDKAQQKMAQMEMDANRPMIFENTPSCLQEQGGYRKAFSDYIRKGVLPAEEKSLNALSEREGGALIPQDLSSKIHATLQKTSSIRGLSRVEDISSSALELLVDKDEADAGWALETQDRKEHDKTPGLEKIRIPLHEMYSKIRSTQKLLDDSMINVEQWLSDKVVAKMASLENNAFVHGSGKGTPRGILNVPLKKSGEWSWGSLEAIWTGKNGDFNDNPQEQLIDLFHALKPAYLSRAYWLMSRSAQGEIRKLKDPNHGYYIWQPPLSLESPATLLGYPVATMEAMPSLIKDKPSAAIIFGNVYESYQIVDRKEIYTLRDPYSAKPYVEFYTVRRVGGDVVNYEALKVLNFSDGSSSSKKIS